jgi:hypothetical protein
MHAQNASVRHRLSGDGAGRRTLGARPPPVLTLRQRPSTFRDMAHHWKRWPRRRLVAIAAVILLLAAILAYWAYYSRQVTGMAAGFPSTAERTIFASTDIEYPDLGALTASSDFVVRGTIQEVTEGGTWTFAPDSGLPAGGQVDRLLSIRVDETVYSASGEESPSEIFVLEGIWQAGTGVQRAELPWAQPGDRGYFFVVDYEEYRDNKTFTYVDSAGRVLITGESAVISDHHDTLWQAANFTELPDGSADLDQVEEVILDAAGSARTGESKPVADPEPDTCPRTEQCPKFER